MRYKLSNTDTKPEIPSIGDTHKKKSNYKAKDMTNKQKVLLIKPNAQCETWGFGKFKAYIITVNMKNIGSGVTKKMAWSNALYNLQLKKTNHGK
jgi:hypothetical protein